MQIVSRERAHGNGFLNVLPARCQPAAIICYSFTASGESPRKKLGAKSASAGYPFSKARSVDVLVVFGRK
jgi:hypothetical protein